MNLVENLPGRTALFFCPFCEKTVEKPKSNGARDQSCGCARNQLVGRALYRQNSPMFKHGLSKRNPLYWIWTGMRQRCRNPKNCNYQNYGMRGITITAQWEEFKDFQKWAVVAGYQPGLTIERKDNNQNYTPENCCWIERKHQPRNQRQTKIHPHMVPDILQQRRDGKIYREIASQFGVSRELIRHICNNKRHKRIIL